MSKNTCLACYGTLNEDFKLECSCQICLECFTEWIVTSNRDTQFEKEEFYTCPNYNCKRKIEKEWIIENIGTYNLNILNDTLISKYLTTTNDIQKCPKDNCNYAGIYSKECSDYECNQCSYKWSNKNEIKPFSSLFKKEYFKEFILSDLSDLYVKIFSRPCYHCGKFVSKTFGCDHITCVCRGEFCYLCLDNWNSHRTSNCISKRDFMYCHFLFLFFVFLLKIVFSFDIISYVIKSICWLIGLNLLVVFIIAISWLVTYVSFRKGVSLVAYLFIATEMFLLYMYYRYYYDDFITLLKIIGLELVVVIAGVVIFGLLMILKYFFKR
jgi:hypothetical protein